MNFGQVSYTSVPVTKQYDLLLAEGWVRDALCVKRLQLAWWKVAKVFFEWQCGSGCVGCIWW